ncbi:PEP-CTERM sorting domain-containing protein [Duganella sp. FT80W]|uniref:PEP-CTERM sorting domain-containing protein n=1 Tax=Duganella guangzhouensis TaxID=2666084 RepID=A0A6I2LAY9_9BURK|nr:PEP-CTERM sorting domain-containing protein [Duganella guangzhouensis]MRW93916.1 PEP-CTERM sorting domain-containing protein [Duganella guangzhouensis]
MKNSLRVSVVSAAFAFCVSPAFAAAKITPSCTVIGPTSVVVEDCTGFFDGNLINHSPADDAAQAASVLALGGGVWNEVWVEKKNFSNTSTITFDTKMVGETIIGFHMGGGKDYNQSTAFYRFDAGAGLYSITTNAVGLSDAAIYMTTPVPEPETYAMLVMGLGLLAITRRRKT